MSSPKRVYTLVEITEQAMTAELGIRLSRHFYSRARRLDIWIRWSIALLTSGSILVFIEMFQARAYAPLLSTLAAALSIFNAVAPQEKRKQTACDLIAINSKVAGELVNLERNFTVYPAEDLAIIMQNVVSEMNKAKALGAEFHPSPKLIRKFQADVEKARGITGAEHG